jgi:hypothetical protein
MRIGLALLLLLALCVSCASPAPKSPAAAPGGTVQQATPAAAVPPTSVIVTTDPHAVTGCRRITSTEQGYDIRESDQWRKLQEEAARLGGNTVLVSTKGDRKAEIFSCSKP